MYIQECVNCESTEAIKGTRIYCSTSLFIDHQVYFEMN